MNRTSVLLICMLALASTCFTQATTNTCSARGGCTCDCSWANAASCQVDDGSCCFACCCSNAPTPAPTPAPGPGPTSAPSSNLTAYCPSSNDLVVAYGSLPQIFNQGWAIIGGGAVATKSAFNLLGGYVEYDVDFSNVPVGVNANLYTISPIFTSNVGFTQSNYCDGQGGGTGWCMEIDYIETNGNCGGQTTIHTRAGGGTDGCTAWGCEANYLYNGKATFHMKVMFAEDGSWTVIRDGQTITGGSLNPSPQSADWDTLRTTYATHGGVIYSSQWTGWVPRADCGTSGNLGSAKFSVSNLVVYGRVVQGPTPKLC